MNRTGIILIIVFTVIAIITTVLLIVLLPKKGTKIVIKGETAPSTPPLDPNGFVQDPRIEKFNINYSTVIPKYDNLDETRQEIYRHIYNIKIFKTINGVVQKDEEGNNEEIDMLKVINYFEQLQTLNGPEHICTSVETTKKLIDLFDAKYVELTPPRLMLYKYINDEVNNSEKFDITCNGTDDSGNTNVCTHDINTIESVTKTNYTFDDKDNKKEISKKQLSGVELSDYVSALMNEFLDSNLSQCNSGTSGGGDSYCTGCFDKHACSMETGKYGKYLYYYANDQDSVHTGASQTWPSAGVDSNGRPMYTTTKGTIEGCYKGDTDWPKVPMANMPIVMP